MESILTSIKSMLGISEDDTSFDAQIIMHINSVFTVLNQLGLGPSEGFVIEDETAQWIEFIPDLVRVSALKSYMAMKVKLIFDPPTNSAVLESMNRTIDEFEFRLNIAAETT